jgi:hypothetical protein
MYSLKRFRECTESSVLFNTTIGEYYSSIMCLKEIKKNNNNKNILKEYSQISPFITESLEEIKEYQKNRFCVLNKGHEGKCNCNPRILLNKKMNNKLKGVYSTPGNDDYVFKNRASRLFPIILPKEIEYSIKNKNKKLKCAIPLRDHTTPFMLATAYLDILVLLMNVKGSIISTTNKEYLRILDSHKEYLKEYYSSKGLVIFDSEGNTMCPVKEYSFTTKDFERDSRFNPEDTDPQIGHVIPRSEKEYTIRGLNLCILTRSGNIAIGDKELVINNKEYLNN